MDIPLEYVAFIAIILGIIGRTYFPYLRKIEEAKATCDSITFDLKFILTAVFTGIVTGIFVYPLFVLPENASALTVFISAFIFSWGANDVVNRVAHSNTVTVTEVKEIPVELKTTCVPSTEIKINEG